MGKLSILRRLEQILHVAAEHELLYAIEQARLSHHLPLRLRLSKKQQSHAQPETLVAIFEELGGAFLKLGQVLALRPDLIGSRYSTAFEQMLDHVPAEKWADIKTQVAQHVPGGMGAFKSFSKEPLAAGSIAQVHLATLKNGRKVAVKIKRPGIAQTFEQDIAVMHYLAEQAHKHLDLAFANPLGIVNEFRKYTEKELDLAHEARNLERFALNFKGDRTVFIPRVHHALSGSEILVMDFVDGTSALALSKTRKITRAQTKAIVSMAYTQLFEHGFFHADLHPANIFITRNGQIALLDFGIVGFVDNSLRRKLFALFSALTDGNVERTTGALLTLNISDSAPNAEKLKEGIYHVLGEYYGRGLSEIPLSAMFHGAIDVARESRIEFPPQLVLFGKSIVTLEGFVRETDPRFDLIASAKPFIATHLRNELRPKNVVKQLASSGMELHNLLLDAPQLAIKLSQDIGLAEKKLADMERSIHYAAHTFWKVSRLLVFSIVFAAVFITSGLLINIQPQFYNISIYSLVGMAVCLALLLAILKSVRDLD